MRIKLDVDVYPQTFLDTFGRDRDELIEFIKEIDERVAEVDFTVKLIQELMDSLTGDLTEEEIKNIWKPSKL